MKSLIIGLLLCFVSPIVTAYLDSLHSIPTQDKNSLNQVRSLENTMSQLLPRMSRPERHNPTTKKPSPVISKSSGSLPTSSRGLSHDKPTLERSSSKRKETTALATPPSQRSRITGPSSINGGGASNPIRNPSGKPPLHPSFKSSPAYAIKMKQLTEKRAQREEFQRQWHNVLPDASFLSKPSKTANSFPDFAQTSSPSYQPPPYRSQAITPSTGRFVSVH